MQATLKLIDDAITRGWANTAHLSEIRDTLVDEATHDLDVLESKVNALQAKLEARDG